MKNTLKTTTTSETKLGWDTADIFSANLMFPTRHFASEIDLKKLGDEEFSQLMISILEPVQPLTNHERSELAKSVKSGNRLRTYYQTLEVEKRYLATVNDLKDNACEDARLKDKFDHTHVRIVDAEELNSDLEAEAETQDN